ncbi:MAG: 4-demethylwyosine synthase TYW1 [Nanoarchaeota archaeon]|nr:4-demethylwyosine synthase TYW1 [Nanoarchaeota archaeon]
MIPEKRKRVLKKQHYEIVGKHSAVQICRWTKKSLKNEGVCYKEKFYGIKSHLCCQMTPSVVWCPNKCLHCWRDLKLTLGSELKGKIDSPNEIINCCIKVQRKLLLGFKRVPLSKKKQLSKANMKKWEEAQEPMQFAISLSGEPTTYEKIGELIQEIRRRGKTSFLVTNGLYPEKVKELGKKNQLPTQLYVSVNTPNKKLYDKFHRSSKKDAWERLNKTLEIISKLKEKTRTVFRMNLVKDLNMIEPENYAKMIKKANPLFIEIKGFMSVGSARERLGYDKMPLHEEVIEFAKTIMKELKKIRINVRILDEHYFSRAVVLGKNKEDLKIKKSEI